MRKFSAAARISSPMRVKRSSHVMPASSAALTAMVTTCNCCNRTPNSSTGAARPGRKSTPFGRESTNTISSFSRNTLTANDAISRLAGSARRNGRKASRSVPSASTTAASSASTTAASTGRPAAISSA